MIEIVIEIEIGIGIESIGGGGRDFGGATRCGDDIRCVVVWWGKCGARPRPRPSGTGPPETVRLPGIGAANGRPAAPGAHEEQDRGRTSSTSSPPSDP